MGDTQRSPSLHPDPAGRRGEAMRGATSRGHARLAHIRRCQAAGPPREEDIQRMVNDYLARGGQVQTCDPAYALPVQNGAGRSDVRS